MMDAPLTLTHLLDRGARLHPAKEVVSLAGDGSVTRIGWAGVRERAARLAGALLRLGLRRGDRVATLAWNTHRHLELYFAVPAIGGVLHTVNARLSPGQVARIVAHAGDRFLFADADLVSLADGVEGLEARVVLDGRPPVPGWQDYEELVRGATPAEPVRLDENEAAALCYTSGTTGDPKGVLYSHRALALHTLTISLPDAFALGERDVILPAVPMFHATAWGLPFAAALSGATLVLPGPRPGADLLASLLEDERVTFAAGVPTVWWGVLDELRRAPRRLSRRLRIHSGGAPTPAALVRGYDDLGVEILSGWGMTELSPVGMVCRPRAAMAEWDEERLLRVRTSQGTPLPFVEARVVDEEGRGVAADGRAAGELEVRGPWVAAAYYPGAGGETEGGEVGPQAGWRDGWLRTGDVATVDAWGYVRLVDRTKDLIRSGGEWISSVQLEDALMDHPAVADVAVVAAPDDRWGERPVACVVFREGSVPEDPASVLEALGGRFPSWWRPDRVEMLGALPRTTTGKVDKKLLRRLVTPPSRET